MEIDLEKIKKLPPDIKKDFMKMYLRLAEKKKILKIRKDFLSFTNTSGQNSLKASTTKLLQKNLTR